MASANKNIAPSSGALRNAEDESKKQEIYRKARSLLSHHLHQSTRVRVNWSKKSVRQQRLPLTPPISSISVLQGDFL